MIYDLTMCNYDSDLMHEWAGEMVLFLSKVNEMDNQTTILSYRHTKGIGTQKLSADKGVLGYTALQSCARFHLQTLQLWKDTPMVSNACLHCIN